MPGWAIVAIVAIILFSIVQITSMVTGKQIPSGGASDDVEELEKRIRELEAGQERPEIEQEPHIPSKAEENMHAEDRWRLDMLEARLEELEKQRKRMNDDSDEAP
ncbi:V-type ATPase 116kDa subunit family protein [Nesterenkonia ebinurensis]|uniref:V-type ATPase 116kDa subunit family protein n=1 Tax=Nesterenkonia ebinurensis TaxID=2608252 RepID=UPI00123D4127|nr:V-type ATPase 116kDa subunit family protein [Nesterenkonia ebinurensis]